MIFEKNGYKFYPVLFDSENNNLVNTKFIPFIFDLFFRYKDFLIDDYYPENESMLLECLIGEINAVYPWFIVGTYKDQPVGFGWFTHWHTSKNNEIYHSAQLHACFDKKFWGKPTLKITKVFLDLLFHEVGLNRIQMEIPENNYKACAFALRAGFKKDGLIRCATFKKGKPLNHVLFSKLKSEHQRFKEG